MQYAFCDETGAFGFDFDKDGVSTHFIVTAIIVNEEDLNNLNAKIDTIRARHFKDSEMKSNKIKGNHRRRLSVLSELRELPFSIYCFVADKRKIYEQTGLRRKPFFYIFLNQFVYNALHSVFQELTIVADETGGNEFMRGFAEYTKKHNPDLTLFDTFNFKFDKSQHGLLIQVADIVGGSLAYCYDEKKKAKAGGTNYKSFLSEKLLGVKFFPREYESFRLREEVDFDNSDDALISEICYRKALFFKQKYDGRAVDNEEIKMQLAVLDYLLFRFMNNSIRKYIPTHELIEDLQKRGFEQLNIQTFRNKIIAKLRDSGVIIASSKKGYKIPSKQSEVEDFIRHGQTIIEPMISRIKMCDETIRMGTNNKIRKLNSPQYEHLKRILSVED